MKTEKPVFVFSSSWRSGSTLVQRFITASGEVLVWGETGGALNSIQQSFENWEQITAIGNKKFPGGLGGNGEKQFREFVQTKKQDHAQLWIANLSPPFSEITQEIKSLLIRLYQTKALELGYPRFGIKETRCNITTARTLLRIFPDAKFVFLVRNPLDVIKSIKRRNWMGRPANHSTLRYFANHWLQRSEEFRNNEIGITFRYEDFISDSMVRDRLINYLEIENHPGDDFVQTSQVDWEANDFSDLSLTERFMLRIWLREEMRRWNY